MLRLRQTAVLSMAVAGCLCGLYGCGGGGGGTTSAGNSPVAPAGRGTITGRAVIPGQADQSGIVVVAEPVSEGQTRMVAEMASGRHRSPETARAAATVYQAVTAADGSYTISDVPVGTYSVSAHKADVLGAVRTNVEVTTRAATVVDLQLTPTGHITGKVTLQGRTEHSWATVAVLGTSYAAYTNGTGTFTITNIPVGTYTVSAYMALFAGVSWSNVEVKAGQTATISTKQLDYVGGQGPNTGDVSGRVVDMTGNPIANATVKITPLAAQSKTTFTAADGTYNITDLTIGSAQIEVSREGRATQHKDITIPAGTELKVADIAMAETKHLMDLPLYSGTMPTNTGVTANGTYYPDAWDAYSYYKYKPVFTLNRAYNWFECLIAVDDSRPTGTTGSLSLSVDGVTKYSESVTQGSPVSVKVGVSDAQRIKIGSSSSAMIINPRVY